MILVLFFFLFRSTVTTVIKKLHFFKLLLEKENKTLDFQAKRLPSAGVVVRNKMRQSYISRTVCPRITKFYANLHIPRSTTTPDMTSLTTSSRVGSYSEKNLRKCRLRRLRVEFLENGLSKDHQISHGCRGHWSQKPAGYDVTRYFQSAAKCS